MKLVIEGEVFAWQKRGGISRVYCEVLPRLRVLEPEWTVIIVSKGRSKSRMLDESLGSIEEIPQFSLKFRPWRLRELIAPIYNKHAENKYWKNCGADVFHPTYFSTPPVDSPSVCFVYDMLWELFPDCFPTADATALSAQKKSAVEQASIVLCISENTKSDLIRLWDVPEEKCRVAMLGVSAAKTAVVINNIDTPYLLYVGNYRLEYKNFIFMLKSFGASKLFNESNQVIVVVSPDEPNEEELITFRNALGSDCIRFESNCDDERLASLYAGCSAYVMPSLYEGFGLPILEAMSHGAPVVCSNTSSLPEVGGDAAYYFDPKSEDDFSSALARALSDGRDPELVQRRKERAGTFSWDHTTKVFRDAFVDAAGMRNK